MQPTCTDLVVLTVGWPAVRKWPKRQALTALQLTVHSMQLTVLQSDSLTVLQVTGVQELQESQESYSIAYRIQYNTV